ncbi:MULTISPECIES: restriction endonuclease subunit S [unclassified Microcoleus]|uniref:restriction endonuclease subunit S n=1 Tax=unclassified Microcoleus TaxID=2642155 RepID=UPI002FCF9F6E
MKNLSTSWTEVSLGEICEFKYGKSLPELKRTGGNIPVFGSNGIIGQHHEAITDGSTIVIGRKGSLGEVNFSNVSCWPIDTTYYIDKSATETDLKWLAYQLSGLGLTKLNKAAAVPGLNREDAYRQRLLLPPLEEQKRIAEVLDRAEELRSKRREAIAQLDTLTQAIFIEMFGDPVTNPKNIKTLPLAKVCKRITDGTHQPPKWSTSGYPFLFVSNIISGEITFDTAKFISSETHEELTRRCPIEVGDVLYSTVGSYGVPVIVKTQRKFAFQRHIAHIKPDSNLIDSQFLCAMLASPSLKRQADRSARGVAQKTVNLEEIRKFIIFCPSISLQQEFARRAEAVEKLKAAHRASLSELDALFASLQHRAFRGEL